MLLILTERSAVIGGIYINDSRLKVYDVVVKLFGYSL